MIEHANTLLVRYTPRTGSRTARLVDHALERLGGPVVELDLAVTEPELFDSRRIDAYTQRNYGRQPLDADQAAAMAQMDAFTQQVIDAQQVILAFPVYNFSVPGAVKAWIDAVVQKNRTWTINGGNYTGLMQGRRALVIATAGGPLSGDFAHLDHAVSLARKQFEFMGFDRTDTVLAERINAEPDKADDALAAARRSIAAVIDTWNSAD